MSRGIVSVAVLVALALPMTAGVGVGHPPTSVAEAASRPPAAVAADPVIAAAGDIACAPGKKPNAKHCQQGATSNLLVGGGFSMVLPLGDNQYECGALSAYNGVYDPTWGRVKAISRPVPGDNDYAGTCKTPGASGYFSYFGDTATPRQPGCRSACQGWYSYDIGAWHVVALNSQCTQPGVGGCTAASAQAKWLDQDLTAHPAACTLAYWHQPYWGNGRLDGATKAFIAILVAHHVDVVLGGHAHLYARYAKQDAASRPDADGIRQFIVGTGGNSHSTLKAALPNRQVGNDTTYGVLSLTLHASRYDWRFLPVAGGTFTDSGSDACA
jgi:hypothetical protein